MNREQINIVLEDLKILFKEKEILGKDFDNFLKKIKSDTVRNYLLSLKNHSQPEQALKDAFFSINSIFAKYLFKKLHPEVGGESSFVDYLIKDEREEIKLEIKPLFEAEFEEGKSGEIFKRIKKVKLNWEKHKDQIRKYLGRKGEFVVFTNLEEWYFFSRNFSLDENCYYFAKVNLFDLIKDFQQIGDFWQYLDRQEELSVKEPLDKKFFNSLKTWVGELSNVKFKVDEKKKTELIIKLINKFIFVQTLDNFWVIKGKYLVDKWVNIEREWQAKNKLRILKKFLSEINEYFYELYDTELFRDEENGKTILNYIERTDENIELFYNKLKLVLGIDCGTTAIGWERGIIQYNFRRIDEDILGKAYETFLAEVRKEQGIYYTPKYITQYIVENTVGKIYDDLLEKIKKNLEEKNFDECKELIKKFISIKVLDPACGSGSFLIKALRLIWNKYSELNKILENEEGKYIGEDLSFGMESRELGEIKKLNSILNYKDNKDKISKIIIRHIHGNDLDANALEVAKVNLWLEAIKLAPSEFRYDRLPADTNHILPDLEMNLGNGNSLVGLPEDLTIKILKEKHENELKRLFELRKEYLDDPTKEKAIKEINEIKKKLRKELNEEFKKYLEENNLPLEILEKTKPFHWALDFWFVFFDENLEPKEKDDQGFDAVIGNPPYVRIQILNKESPEYVEYLNRTFITSFKNYDLAITFIERGFALTSKQGKFSYIVTSKWMQADYGEKLRELLSKTKSVAEIIDFGNQQVFEDATTYTVIPLLEKKEHETFGYMFVKRLKKILDQLHLIHESENYEDEFVRIIVVKEDTLSESSWSFSKEREIIEKIEKNKKLGEIAERIFQGLVTGADPVYILEVKGDLGNWLKVYSKSKDKEYILEKALLKPLLKGEEIKRYVISRYDKVILFPYLIKVENKKRKAYLIDANTLKLNYPKVWQYLLDNKEYLEDREKGKWRNKPDWYAYGRRQNLEQMEQPKIMIQVLAIKASFALDYEGTYYFIGGGNAGGYGISLKPNSGISLKYLTSLLNSSILDWRLEQISTQFRGGYHSYARRFIEKLPIKVPKSKKEIELASNIKYLVPKIITLKKLQHKFRDLWRYYSRKFRNNYRSLDEILLDDKRVIQEGNFDKVWISEASVYPDEQNELLEKEFKKFRIVGEGDNKLKIYGIEGQREELLLEITTSKKEFRDIIYLELLKLMDSKVKKKTLKDILSKSEISVIQPNIWEKSGNLLKKTKEKFREWLEKENFEIKEDDIVKIDNRIQEIDNLIDAHVFKLYGLTKEEVEIVLDSLNVVESIKNDILRKFERLK